MLNTVPATLGMVWASGCHVLAQSSVLMGVEPRCRLSGAGICDTSDICGWEISALPPCQERDSTIRLYFWYQMLKVSSLAWGGPPRADAGALTRCRLSTYCSDYR